MADAAVVTDNLKSLPQTKLWLRSLPGGLPVDFNYHVIKSLTDAKALILQLPSCDRARAALDLYRYRRLVGVDAAYVGIMLAWDNDNRQTLEAFGSAKRFIGALRSVVPPMQSSPQKPIQIWRGMLVDRTSKIADWIGLSWTRSRNIACWFALHEYVPTLQPELAPVVLHAHLDRSVIIAQDNTRAEQEVIIDISQLPLTGGPIYLDGTSVSCRDFGAQIADLYTRVTSFGRLIDGWRLAASRYEHWKRLLEARRQQAHRPYRQ